MSVSVFDVTCLITTFLLVLTLILATFRVALLISSPAVHFSLPGVLTGVLSSVPGILALLRLFRSNPGT